MSVKIPLISKRLLCQNTWEYSFSRPKNYKYLSGQYIDLALHNGRFKDNMGSVRSFSFVSRPEEESLRIAFREGTTAYKKNLLALKVGQTVNISQPKGKFLLKSGSESVFVAGGVGVAPIVALLKNTSNAPVIFSNASLKTAPYLEELRELTSKLHIFTTQETSEFTNRRLQADDLKPYISDITIFYICGSSAFVGAVVGLLGDVGVGGDQIITEDFIGY